MQTQDYTPGDLLVGDYPVAVRTVTIGAGQVLKRGAVLGGVAGTFKLSAAAETDGSEVPSAVLAVDVDTTAGPVQKRVYTSAGFDSSKLILGEGHTVDTVEAAFREASAPLYIHKLA
ncbi:bacteriophage lambda head decoration D family protein [Ochrobactrum quorumnocens]|uniref:Bacteriophage lambda head decoration D family protein n=1 Tax=Ochrobactrum quorumnocens TaxID=271865 RepID=A0A248UIZ9_9HYPH|nr:head decoration protein [[Ochrobactrum] quorumnocens]ASV86705.1 bacteriophage lambda head decoration D family protein [[Ochrobactrum] quorumnocens]